VIGNYYKKESKLLMNKISFKKKKQKDKNSPTWMFTLINEMYENSPTSGVLRQYREGLVYKTAVRLTLRCTLGNGVMSFVI
jgi:hypothetical protein